MNNLAEVCLVGLGVRGNYVRCLVVVVINMKFGGAKRCEGSLKSSFCGVVVKAGAGWVLEGYEPQRGTSFYGGVDPSVHHEGGSQYVILLF